MVHIQLVLMALDSNSMKDRCGNKLRHFTPYPSPLSSGVDMFSQDLYGEVNPYVFPPFHLISSVLKYFESQKIDRCTMIVPDMQPTPVWWPKLRSNMESYFVIGEIGEVNVIRKPSKKGYMLDKDGLKCRGVARVWQPAVLCPSCKYANDISFKFCQACDFVNDNTNSEVSVIDYDIEKRL
ncbi:hypothetical protein KUTeg_001755, partial [Tegillarca granosa]